MKNIAAAVTLICFAAPALAETGPTYEHFDFGYERTERSGNELMTGYGIGGTYGITENHHITAAYGDIDNSTRETQLALLMYGYRWQLSDRTDFYVRGGLAWQRTYYFAPPATIVDSGFSVALGVRSMITERYELSGFIGAHETHRVRGTLSIENYYHFTPRIGGFASVDLGDRGWNLRVGARINFD